MRMVFIDVVVHNTKDGDQIPLVIIWEDNRRYGVDKVLDIRMAAASKVGGCIQGTRVLQHALKKLEREIG